MLQQYDYLQGVNVKIVGEARRELLRLRPSGFAQDDRKEGGVSREWDVASVILSGA